MNLHKLLFTNSYVYKNCPNMSKILGIMVHSTGCNNPNLRRYVGPDDGLLGPTSSMNWNQYTINGQVYKVNVHAFIGKLKDGSIATYQTQEWNKKCNHCGVGTTGKSANTNYISFEICEDSTDNKEYFDKVYREAVELCAYLCEKFKLDPLKNIICHSEGYTKGIASNHKDVMHWFVKHGKTMNNFRVDVYNEMEDNNMDDTRFDEHMVRWAARQAAKPGSKAAEFVNAQKKATTKGIIKGNAQGQEMWKSYVTRDELMIFLDRAGVL